MPKLGEYIGALVSEIVRARVISDQETIRVAEYYSKDALLKNMTLPRFRLPSLNIDIPFAIKDYRDNQELDINYTEIRFSTVDILNEKAQKYNFKIDKSEIKTFSSIIDKILDDLKPAPKGSFSLEHLVDGIVFSAIEFLRKPSRYRKPIESRTMDNIATEMKEECITKFSGMIKESIAGIEIIANTAELKEMGSKDLMTTIKFSFTEEGYEWKTLEVNGVKERKLLPE